MTVTRKELLNKNLPAFLKNYPNTVAYVDACGDFIDETVEAIININNSHKYNKVGTVGLDAALREMGFNMPTNVPEATKRQYLRDGMEIIIRSGTADGIIAAFRLIGISAQIQEAWIVSPDLVERGLIWDIENESVRRYDVNPNAYQDMLFGDAEVKDDGVFFKGFRYNDFERVNSIEDVPIFDEYYETTNDSMYTVGKSPYVLVFIDDATVNLVTDSKTDPVTGEVYTYSDNERFKLVNDIIEYFAYKTSKPTNMRVIVVISPSGGADFDDSIDINDDIETPDIYTTLPPVEPNDIRNLDETMTVSGEVTINSIKIGDPVLIGKPSPYESQFSLANVTQINSSGVFDEIDWGTVVPHSGMVLNHYPAEGRTPPIPLYPESFVGITGPLASSITCQYFTHFSDTIPAHTQVIPATTGLGGLVFENKGRYHKLNLIYANPELIYVQPINIAFKW